MHIQRISNTQLIIATHVNTTIHIITGIAHTMERIIIMSFLFHGHIHIHRYSHRHRHRHIPMRFHSYTHIRINMLTDVGTSIDISICIVSYIFIMARISRIR